MSTFNEGVSKMIERLTLKADGKTEVFMLDELNKMTLDAIAKVRLKTYPTQDVYMFIGWSTTTMYG